MEQIVLDTDIIIDFLRTGKGLFFDLLELQGRNKVELFITAASIYELFSGQSSKTTADDLADVLSKLHFIPFDFNNARLAGEINRDLNYSLKFADLIIAVASLNLNMRLATKNKKHFTHIPKLKFYSP